MRDHRTDMNKPLREQLAEDVRRFIARGGKVQRLREGEMSEAGAAMLKGKFYSGSGKKAAKK